jgi:hypothetical protein
MNKNLGAALAAAVLLATAACGGGGGAASSRPSEDEISKALQKGVNSTAGAQKLTKKQADCAAKVFEKSKISDKALKAIVSGDKKFKESKADDAALKKVLPELQKCA